MVFPKVLVRVSRNFLIAGFYGLSGAFWGSSKWFTLKGCSGRTQKRCGGKHLVKSLIYTVPFVNK